MTRIALLLSLTFGIWGNAQVKNIFSESISTYDQNSNNVFFIDSANLAGGATVSGTGTLCGTQTTFSDTFDSYIVSGTSVMPDCWDKVLAGSGNSVYVKAGGVTAGMATNCVDITAAQGTANSAYAVLPVVTNLGAYTHQLRFKVLSDNANNNIVLGFFDSGLNPASFHVLQSFIVPSLVNSGYQEYVFAPPAMPGVNSLVLKVSGSASSNATVYIDDVIWEPKPVCEKISDLNVSAITGTTANMNWTGGNGISNNLTDTQPLYKITYIPPIYTSSVQGYTFDGNNHYIIGTNRITKYDNNYNIIVDNNNAQSGILGVDHLGDGVYLNGYLYIVAETYPQLTGMQIAKYDATNLKLVTTYDVSAQGHECSSIATDGTYFYISSYNDGTKIWKYSLTGNYIGYTTISSPFTNNIQGISFYQDYFYITEQVNLYKIKSDGTSKTFIMAAPDDVSYTHRSEGLQVVNGEIRWLVMSDNQVYNKIYYINAVPSTNVTKWQYAITNSSAEVNPDNLPITDASGTTPTLTLSGLQPLTNYKVWIRTVCNASNYGSWAGPVSFTTICEIVTPTFTQVPAICSGATLSDLPTTSNNSIKGTWSPALNNSATTTYTFTPNPDQCPTPATMTIPVNPLVTPIFTQVPAICPGTALSDLPTTSNNTITGSWSPALSNTATTTYTFTPNADQCATTSSMTITVKEVPSAPTIGSVIQPTCLSSGNVQLNSLPSSENWTIIQSGATSNTYTGNGDSYTVPLNMQGDYTFVTQTSCSSSDASSPITINGLPAVPAPTGNPVQTFPAGKTVGDIVFQKSSNGTVLWYKTQQDAFAGTNPLDSSETLQIGQYYAMQFIDGCISTTPLVIFISVTSVSGLLLDVNQFDMAALTYYPDPVREQLNIEYSHDINSIRLYNLLGQNITTVSPKGVNAKIDMADLPNGTYFLEIRSEEKSAMIKVMKANN